MLVNLCHVSRNNIREGADGLVRGMCAVFYTVNAAVT